MMLLTHRHNEKRVITGVWPIFELDEMHQTCHWYSLVYALTESFILTYHSYSYQKHKQRLHSFILWHFQTLIMFLSFHCLILWFWGQPKFHSPWTRSANFYPLLSSMYLKNWFILMPNNHEIIHNQRVNFDFFQCLCGEVKTVGICFNTCYCVACIK